MEHIETRLTGTGIVAATLLRYLAHKERFGAGKGFGEPIAVFKKALRNPEQNMKEVKKLEKSARYTEFEKEEGI